MDDKHLSLKYSQIMLLLLGRWFLSFSMMEIREDNFAYYFPNNRQKSIILTIFSGIIECR